MSRELSLEEASRILSDFLAGRNNSETIEPQTVDSLIEIVGFVSPANTTLYYVQPGDTLYKIARNYNTTVDQIKRDNNLLILITFMSATASINNSTSNVIYTVKAGDTLYKLAERYSTTVREIRHLNNLYSGLSVYRTKFNNTCQKCTKAIYLLCTAWRYLL